MKLIPSLMALILVLPFSMDWAMGQNSQAPESLPRPPASAPAEGASPADVNLGSSWSPRTDLEGGGGFSRNAWTADVGVHFPLPVDLGGPKLFGGLGFSYTGVFYDFSGHPDIAGSDTPWNQVNVADVSAGLLAAVDQHWSSFASFNVKSAAQTGADVEQSFTYGGVVGASYKVSDRLSIGLAIAAQSRLEQIAQVLPFPAFSWVLPVDHDRWRAFSGGGSSGSGAGGRTPGVEIGVSYHPIRSLTFAGGLSSLGLANDFRLNARLAIPDGVVEDHFQQLVLAANYQPTSHLSLTGSVGVDLPGKLKVVSSAGNAVYTELYSAVPVVGVSVGYRF